MAKGALNAIRLAPPDLELAMINVLRAQQAITCRTACASVVTTSALRLAKVAPAAVPTTVTPVSLDYSQIGAIAI